MKRQLRGIALLLLSILLMLGFCAVGWDCIFGLDLTWQHIFMVLGIVGAVMVFLPDKSDK